MNTYELTLMTPDPTSPMASKGQGNGDKEKIIKVITAFVKKAKGEVLKQDSWGVKTLAYEINKQKTADYEFLVLSLDPKDQPELDKTLSLTEGILRYLFIRV